MVNYSIDTNIRVPAYFWMAVISIFLSYLINCKYFIYLKSFFFTAPSAAVIFSFLVYIFDIFIWKLKNINKLLGVPDLNGEWIGFVKRALINKERNYEEIQAIMIISQTWHRISLIVESNISISNILIAGLFIENKKNLSIRYSYIVRDKTGSKSENYFGEGTAELMLRCEGDKKILAGPYYSTKSIEGYLEFEFKKK